MLFIFLLSLHLVLLSFFSDFLTLLMLGVGRFLFCCSVLISNVFSIVSGFLVVDFGKGVRGGASCVFFEGGLDSCHCVCFPVELWFSQDDFFFHFCSFHQCWLFYSFLSSDSSLNSFLIGFICCPRRLPLLVVSVES